MNKLFFYKSILNKLFIGKINMRIVIKALKVI